MQLTAQGAFDSSQGIPGCGPNAEQDTFTLPLGARLGVGCNAALVPIAPLTQNCVYGTRNALLSNNYCPGAQTLCYGSNNTLTTLSANSIYNAGEVTLEHKAGDLTFLAAYTFAKALDDSSGFNDLVNFVNPKLSRGLSSSDVRHNFVISYVWDLPFDRIFAGGPKRLTRGWQLDGITRFSSGFPVQMNQSSGDASLAGSGSTDMPNLVGPIVKVNPRDVNTQCPSYDPTIPGSGTGCYFLPSAFAVNTTLGTFGTANRRFFHGPGISNFDVGISKRIPVTESKAFEIRGEFFNVFNHAQFFNPTGDIDSSNFGEVTQARDPRIGQVSAKFVW